MAGFVALTDIFVQIVQGEVHHPERTRDHYERWFDQVAPGADGWLSSTAGVTEDNEFVAVVRFASELAVRANTQRPEHTRWWEEMQREFAAPATVHHCARVATFGESRPDHAGFAQVVQGTTGKLSEVLENVAETEQHHIYEHHLNVTGGLVADHGDHRFTELIYYPSDEAARHSGTEGLARKGVSLVERLAGVVADVRYFDLHDPIVRHR